MKRESLLETTIIQLYKMFQDEVEDFAGKPIDWKSLDRTGKPADKLLIDDIHCAENGGMSWSPWFIPYGTMHHLSGVY